MGRSLKQFKVSIITVLKTFSGHCLAHELVVLVFEQDVERGQRSVTARDILLQVELVRIAQFAWHAVASAKEGRSRSPSARELAD